MTNLFIVSHGTLITPDLTRSGVEGVMRNLVRERAAELSIPCRIAEVKPEEVLTADEIFLSNSLVGIWPVRRLEGREYAVGKTTQQLQEAIFDACVAD